MNMQSRNQYLLELRSEYLRTKLKKIRGELLNEAEKRTKLSRKHLIMKLRSKSNLDTKLIERKKKKEYYDNSIKPALVIMWKIFDKPCGQRLEPLLKSETEKLRLLGELNCSDLVAKKLKEIGTATIDRKLKQAKRIEIVNAKYKRSSNPLLYQKIPVKVFEEQDRDIIGNMQIDLVEHCGSSASGEFVNSLTATDIYSGWTEQSAVMGKSQENTKIGIDNAKTRCPFEWQEIHSDCGTEFINYHLFSYSQNISIKFSRSRPYKKNDNCLVEQKNWTHVRKNVGYLRYDTFEELNLLNDLYCNEWRLYKNFFSPVIKLVLKERVGGKIHRKYDKPKTPFRRLIKCPDSVILKSEKQKLEKTYLSLNPAELKRVIDKKLNNLYEFYKQKNSINNLQKVDSKKKISVRISGIIQNPVSVR